MTLSTDLRAMMPGAGYRSRPMNWGEADHWAVSEGGLIIPTDADVSPPQPSCIDLFAGCGGFTLGMNQAGFATVAAVEWWIDAARTYQFNLGAPGCVIHVGGGPPPDARKADRAFFEQYGGRTISAEVFAREYQDRSGRDNGCDDTFNVAAPDECRTCRHIFLEDARKLKGSDILDALDMERGEPDRVVGGPPCQGYSKAGKQNVMGGRNSLVFEFCRLVCEINPKAMVMEEVPDIVYMQTPDGLPVVDVICRILEDGGFSGFDAVKKTLESIPGTRAVMRTKQMAGEEEEASEQADLFGEPGA